MPSIVLGAIWAAWHIIAMLQTGQSAAWIAWGCLDMVATRVIMVWLYNNTGRAVIAVVLFHAVANLTFKSVFPGGSYESERIISVILHDRSDDRYDRMGRTHAHANARYLKRVDAAGERGGRPAMVPEYWTSRFTLPGAWEQSTTSHTRSPGEQLDNCCPCHTSLVGVSIMFMVQAAGELLGLVEAAHGFRYGRTRRRAYSRAAHCRRVRP